MTVALFAPIPLASLSYLSDDEADLVSLLSNRLALVNVANAAAEQYYEGTFLTEQFGISVPPSMSHLRTVAGWPGTTCDVLEERLDWLGWTIEQPDDFGLGEIYRDNQLDVDSGAAHLDGIIFGCSFVVVGAGEDDEPEVLITMHSPKDMTSLYDPRRRRSVAGLSITAVDNGAVTMATLYLPDQTVRIERAPSGGQWVVIDRDQHNLGRLPVVKMANRTRASRTSGRSEITNAVRYYTDAACRTLLGLEVNREFYNSPQRVALNVSEKAFQDAQGNPVSAWTAIQGRVWAIPPNDDGEPPPSVQQFSPSSPAPYLDQIRGYAQLLAAEAGMPGAYLGFHTDNPSSADAIRAGEARLVKRAERRQTTFGKGWLEVGRLALLVRDGDVPVEYANVSARWRDAATPTRAAAADEASKLIAAQVLPPGSTVTYDRIGLTPAEQRQLDVDKRRATGREVLAALTSTRGAQTGVSEAPSAV